MWDVPGSSSHSERWQGQPPLRSQVPQPRLGPTSLGEQTGSMVTKPSSARIAHSVWRLSRHPDGCREVQAALEEADSEEVRASVAAELRGHIWEALRCPHANYVVQKCIVTMQPQASQFIIDELLRRGPGTAAQAARHRFGCRILERLLEHCLPCQLVRLVEDIIVDAVALSSHPYGNYVVQHIIEHGIPDHQQRLSAMLAQNALAMGSDGYASAVVAKALAHGAHASRLNLARAAFATPGLLAVMARTRHGHVAVKLILQLLEESPTERAMACRELEADAVGLRSSRYGRFVALDLEQRCGRAGDKGGSSCDDSSKATKNRVVRVDNAVVASAGGG